MNKNCYTCRHEDSDINDVLDKSLCKTCTLSYPKLTLKWEPKEDEKK